MQAVCWAAKVMACAHWASISIHSVPPKAAVSAKRKAVSSAAAVSQWCKVPRSSMRPWKANQMISTITETAHNRPTTSLL